jgi:Xaa-Pro dipeptidase
MTDGAFTVEEFKGRVARVQEVMAERQLDAVLITRPQNVYYLTGFRSFGAGLAAGMGQIHAALVPASGTPTLFMRALETKVAQKYCWTEAEPYRDYEDAYAAIANRFPVGAKRVGIEHLDITALQLERFRRACPAVEIQDVSMLVERFRRVKSPQELAQVREAARLANLGLRTAIEAVREGVPVSTVIAETTRAMYDAGQDDISWPPVLVWSGPDGGLMHDTSLEGVVKRRDLVTIEITGTCHLYTADAMGTICAGPPSDEIAKAYEVSVALHNAAQRALRPGATGDEVHAECDKVFRGAGHGPYYRRVGSAIGINSQPAAFFEGLNLLKGENLALEKGMTVLVQPGVDKPAMLIVASTNVITDAGCEEVTHPLLKLVSR